MEERARGFMQPRVSQHLSYMHIHNTLFLMASAILQNVQYSRALNTDLFRNYPDIRSGQS